MIVRALALACVLAAAPLAAAELVRGDAVALALRTTGSLSLGQSTAGASFTGGAGLTADLGPVTTAVAASVDLGRDAALPLAPTTRGTTVSLDAAWRAGPIDLTATVASRRETANASLVTGQTQRLVARFAPAAGPQLRLTAEHVLSPPLLLVDPGGTPRALGESEWRVAADARQKLFPGVALAAAVTLAARAGATEFGIGSDLAQVAVPVASGLRRQVSVGLTADLAALGLGGATLTGTGVVRRSSVDDPLTGASRRASGEVPVQATLAFAQALPLRAARWGINTYVDGATDYYGIRDVTRAGVAAGLGAFVDYAPGPLRVQVRVDNLLGGARDQRIDTYQGLRGQSDFDRSGNRAANGRAVSLTLSGKV